MVAFVEESHSEWDQKQPELMFSLNNAEHASTGVSRVTDEDGQNEEVLHVSHLKPFSRTESDDDTGVDVDEERQSPRDEVSDPVMSDSPEVSGAPPTIADASPAAAANEKGRQAPTLADLEETGAPVPRTMRALWTEVKRCLEEARAASRQTRVAEAAALAAYDSFLEEFHCGRELVEPWAGRVKSLREEQALLADTRREKAECRQAEEEVTRAEEEHRVTEQAVEEAARLAREAALRHEEALRRVG